MRKNIALVSAVAAGMIALAGCAGGGAGAAPTVTVTAPSEPAAATSAPAPEPAPTVTVTAPAPEPEPEPTRDTSSSISDDKQVVMLLHTVDPWFENVPDEDIVELTQLICARLDDGYSVRDLAELATDNGMTQERTAALFAAAIVTYCPWEEDNL